MSTSWSGLWPEYTETSVEEPPAPLGPRGVLLAFGGCLLVGVVAGLLWWLLAPAAREWSESAETQIASDGTLVLILIAIGVGHAVLLIVRQGPLGVARVVVNDVAAWAGAVLATGLGLLLGASGRLGILAAAGAWPVAMLAVVAFAEGLRYAFSRET